MTDDTLPKTQGCEATNMEELRALRDDRRKHLDFLQAVIARLAGNSFLIKGWSLTVTGLIIGFAVRESNAGLALVALLPISMFWCLDTYYLHREQLFRKLYEAASDPETTIPVFSMDYRRVEGGKSWIRTAWSTTVWPLYITSITVVAITFIATSQVVTGWLYTLLE